MEMKQQVFKVHKRQIKLSQTLAKVGYDSVPGKLLRFLVYSLDSFTMLQKLKTFLDTARETIGDKFFGLDSAVIHISHAEVKKLMQIQPQTRGKYLGLFRVLSPSYFFNNPLTSGMNGMEHTGTRNVVSQALPSPSQNIHVIGNIVDEYLAKAVKKGELNIGKEVTKIVLDVSHQLLF